jgi:hypothetical protein
LRLTAFVQAFGAAGTSHDLCVDDLAATARDVGRAIAHRLTSRCLSRPVSDCQVAAGDRPLPRCPDAPTAPCWRVEPQPRCLGSGNELTLAGASALPAGARVTARCE